MTMPTPTIYTAAEAAARLGLSRTAVYALIRRLTIGRRHGRDWLLTDADLTTLAARNTKRGRPRSPDALPASIARRAYRARDRQRQGIVEHN